MFGLVHEFARDGRYMHAGWHRFVVLWRRLWFCGRPDVTLFAGACKAAPNVEWGRMPAYTSLVPWFLSPSLHRRLHLALPLAALAARTFRFFLPLAEIA